MNFAKFLFTSTLFIAQLHMTAYETTEFRMQKKKKKEAEDLIFVRS